MIRSLLALFVSAALVFGCGGGCGSKGKSDGGSDGGGGDGGSGDGGDGYQHASTGSGGFTVDGGGGATANGVSENPSGYIVLNSGATSFHFAYISDDTRGWVSKYDTKTGKEVGRYWSVIPKSGLMFPDGGYTPNAQLRGDNANHPSRTAIDLNGDVWVANRAYAGGVYGSVTKIATQIQNCEDRNHNGTIETSQDLNNDGVIQTGTAEMITPTDWTNPLQYDECVIFSTTLPTPGGGVTGSLKGRALAISAGFEGSAGDIWAGVWDAQLFVKLDPVTGAIVPVYTSGPLSIPLGGVVSGGFGPYGATVDSNQRLWALRSPDTTSTGTPGGPQLIAIDTTNGTLLTPAPLQAASFPVTAHGYGIAIDGKGRVWLAAYNGPYAVRFTPPTGAGPYAANAGTWDYFDFSSVTNPGGQKFGRGRGIAADDQGYIWMSGFVDQTGSPAVAHLIAFNGDTGVVKQFNTGTATLNFIDATDANSFTSIGVGLDQDGNVWVNNYSGNVMKVFRDTGVDPNTGTIFKTPIQTGNLYTYSDFTGYALRNFTAPRGTYSQNITGCGAGQVTSWQKVTWTAVVPANTTLQVFVKVGADVSALNNAATTKYGPFTTSPANLQAAGVPAANMLRVEFDLVSLDRVSTPQIQSFDVAYSCSPMLN